MRPKLTFCLLSLFKNMVKPSDYNSLQSIILMFFEKFMNPQRTLFPVYHDIGLSQQKTKCLRTYEKVIQYMKWKLLELKKWPFDM